MKRISIITINYNNREGLRRTIESVVNQICRDFEYIIIDGGSTDGSVDVIKQYADQIDYWVSEPDKGIYNAMNKGVAVAKGEYCLFMNSGDAFYTNDVIKLVYKKTDFRSDIIAGDVVRCGELQRHPERISGIFMVKSALCHQASFIRTETLRRLPYDESLKIVSDWKHMFQILVVANGTYQHMNVVICEYDTTGFSTINWQVLADERDLVLSELLPRLVRNDYQVFLQNEEIYKSSPKVYDLISKIGRDSVDEKIVVLSLSFVNFLRKIKKSLRL